MRYFLKDTWWIILICTIFAGLLIYVVKLENKEIKVKYTKCMNDIHNVYVCETYARGKDVEVIYMPMP